MNHLQTLCVTTRETPQRGNLSIDLFLLDGTLVPLECDAEALRKCIATSHTNLFTIRHAEEEWCRMALAAGWPRPARPGHVIMHHVLPEESVVLHSRVLIRALPNSVVEGAAELEIVSPWVQIKGPAAEASKPVSSEPFDSETCIAGSILLPDSCRLVSPEDQCLYRVVRRANARVEAAR